MTADLGKARCGVRACYFFAIGVLSFCHQNGTICGGCADLPSTAAAQEVSPQSGKEWAQPLKSMLAQIERRSADVKVMSTQLEGIKSQSALPGESERIEQRMKHRQLVIQLAAAQIKLRKDLFQLWFVTGHGDLIVASARRNLPERTDEICANYEKWLQEHQNDDLESVIRSELEANVEAVHSEYCWIALRVLRRWIYFSPDRAGVSGDPDDFVPVTAQSREEAYNAMKKWLDSHKTKLKWSQDRHMFVDDEDKRFDYPQFDLVLHN
jgi:hypothetical protein